MPIIECKRHNSVQTSEDVKGGYQVEFNEITDREEFLKIPDEIRRHVLISLPENKASSYSNSDNVRMYMFQI